MSTKIQVRRGTASEWSSANPVLSLGEFGFDTTNKLLKIGNGSDTWSALPSYFSLDNNAILPVTYGGTGNSYADKTLVAKVYHSNTINGSATAGATTNMFQTNVTSGAGTPKFVSMDSASVYYYETYYVINKAAGASGQFQMRVLYQDTGGTSINPVSSYVNMNIWYSGGTETSVGSGLFNSNINFATATTTADTRWVRAQGFVVTNATTAGKFSLGFSQSGTPTSPGVPTISSAALFVYKENINSGTFSGAWV